MNQNLNLRCKERNPRASVQKTSRAEKFHFKMKYCFRYFEVYTFSSQFIYSNIFFPVALKTNFWKSINFYFKQKMVTFPFLWFLRIWRSTKSLRAVLYFHIIFFLIYFNSHSCKTKLLVQRPFSLSICMECFVAYYGLKLMHLIHNFNFISGLNNTVLKKWPIISGDDQDHLFSVFFFIRFKCHIMIGYLALWKKKDFWAQTSPIKCEVFINWVLWNLPFFAINSQL